MKSIKPLWGKTAEGRQNLSAKRGVIFVSGSDHFLARRWK